MDSQQRLDYIIVPTLKFMRGNYDSKNSRMLNLSTDAVESNCGHKIKQEGGPALGPGQMEPSTEADIWKNCDALKDPVFASKIISLKLISTEFNSLMISPMYGCAMTRLKYSMDKEPLPPHNDIEAIYRYYKRIYNTPAGASTFGGFRAAWYSNNLHKINLDN